MIEKRIGTFAAGYSAAVVVLAAGITILTESNGKPQPGGAVVLGLTAGIYMASLLERPFHKLIVVALLLGASLLGFAVAATM